MLSFNIFNKTEVVEYYKKYPNQYYISIIPTGGPDGLPVLDDVPNVITLVFDDVMMDGPKSLYPIMDGFFEAKAFTDEQAKKLVDFIKKIPPNNIINIHCVEGRSRSVAVAKFILDQFSTGNNLVYKLLNDNC